MAEIDLAKACPVMPARQDPKYLENTITLLLIISLKVGLDDVFQIPETTCPEKFSQNSQMIKKKHLKMRLCQFQAGATTSRKKAKNRWSHFPVVNQTYHPPNQSLRCDIVEIDVSMFVACSDNQYKFNRKFDTIISIYLKKT